MDGSVSIIENRGSDDASFFDLAVLGTGDPCRDCLREIGAELGLLTQWHDQFPASSLQPIFENLTPTTRKRCATTSRWNRRWASPRRGSRARSAWPGRGNGPRRPLAARRGCCRDVEQRALSSCRSADAQRVSHAGAPTIMRLVCQRTAREFRSGLRLFRWRRSSAQAGGVRCRLECA